MAPPFDAWRKMFQGGDFDTSLHPSGGITQSVAQQIYALCGTHFAYRVLLSAHIRVTAFKRPSALRNPLVEDAIFFGYAAREALGVRRLVEPQNAKPGKSVVSLRGLVEDIEKHQLSINREVYVTRGGVPYEFTIAKDAARQAMIQDLDKNGPTRMARPTIMPLGDYKLSEKRHTSFDFLSGIFVDNRTRDQIIDKKIFLILKTVLEDHGGSVRGPIQRIKLFADKIIAHSATIPSLKEFGIAPGPFSFNDVMNAHSVLLGVAEFVARHFVETDLNELITPSSYQATKFLENSGLSERELSRLNCIGPALEARYQRRKLQQYDAIVAAIHRARSEVCSAV